MLDVQLGSEYTILDVRLSSERFILDVLRWKQMLLRGVFKTQFVCLCYTDVK